MVKFIQILIFLIPNLAFSNAVDSINTDIDVTVFLRKYLSKNYNSLECADLKKVYSNEQGDSLKDLEFVLKEQIKPWYKADFIMMVKVIY